jgi:hypothetical protein
VKLFFWNFLIEGEPTTSWSKAQKKIRSFRQHPIFLPTLFDATAYESP